MAGEPRQGVRAGVSAGSARCLVTLAGSFPPHQQDTGGSAQELRPSASGTEWARRAVYARTRLVPGERFREPRGMGASLPDPEGPVTKQNHLRLLSPFTPPARASCWKLGSNHLFRPGGLAQEGRCRRPWRCPRDVPGDSTRMT